MYMSERESRRGKEIEWILYSDILYVHEGGIKEVVVWGTWARGRGRGYLMRYYILIWIEEMRKEEGRPVKRKS